MIMEITKKIPVPTLALQGKWDSINIGVGVIAALGNPSHICQLRNMKEKSLAVIACDGKDTRLFSVSSRRTPCGRTPLTESGLAFSVVSPLQTVEYMRPAFDMQLKE